MDFYQQLFDVSDKVVLVTGGTRGIGLMIAEGLVRAGARVYIASRKSAACEEAEEKLGRYGFCRVIAADVSSISGCRQLAEEIRKAESELPVLVNNAGVTWSEDIDNFHEKAWDKVVDLDVKGAFFLIKHLLPLLRQGATLENRASIVNITRVNALRPSGLRNYSYVAAKAGLGQLSVQLAADLMDEYVNVNVIAPGLFESKMTASLFESEEAVEQLLANQPMKRSGRMEDIAGLVIYLSSKAGQFITGSTIACDGGATSTT